MEDSSAIISPKNTALSLESVSARDCFISWDFAEGNHVLLLQRPTPIFKWNIKKLMRLAKRKDLDLWFEDECHFQQHGSRCAMWIAPDIKDPVILHAPTRKHIGVYGAVRITDGTFVAERADTFDAMTFQGYLKRLFRRHRKGRKMVVIVDNARWHHAKLLHPWLIKHKKAIHMLFLPPYSPDLNAIERVWKLTRRLCTHNQYFPEIEKLVEHVFQQFQAWSKPNDALRRLCAII
jgi:transposase